MRMGLSLAALGFVLAVPAWAKQPECPPPGHWSGVLEQCIVSPALQPPVDTPEANSAETRISRSESPPVQLRRWSRFEVFLTPLLIQINPRYAMHAGIAGSVQVQLIERLGLVVSGGYQWLNEETPFSAELVEKFRVEQSSILSTWSAMAGVEGRPFLGELESGSGLRFSLYVRGLAGATGRRHQLTPLSVNPAGAPSPTYGDLEPRFAMAFGVGLRVELGSQFAVRVELQDTFVPTRMQTVNGCNVDDLRALDMRTRAGMGPAGAGVTAGCRAGAFARTSEIPLALNLIRIPNDEWIQNIQLGLSLAFGF